MTEFKPCWKVTSLTLSCLSARAILPGQDDLKERAEAVAKSEDTILVTEQGQEILTAMNDWPTIPVHISGQTILRPAILERN